MQKVDHHDPAMNSQAMNEVTIKAQVAQLFRARRQVQKRTEEKRNSGMGTY
jgi:hypothetical protein